MSHVTKISAFTVGQKVRLHQDIVLLGETLNVVGTVVCLHGVLGQGSPPHQIRRAGLDWSLYLLTHNSSYQLAECTEILGTAPDPRYRKTRKRIIIQS